MATLRDSLSHSVSLLTGLVVGAAAMYIFDPERGNRRRALARDKMIRGGRMLRTNANKQARNAWNHLTGSLAEARSTMRDKMQEVPDAVLEERVRAQIGHVVSHPGALEVRVEDGCAVISGPILREEMEKIEQRLHATRGLWNWKLNVEPHAGDDSIPGLQGRSRWQRKRESGADESVA